MKETSDATAMLQKAYIEVIEDIENQILVQTELNVQINEKINDQIITITKAKQDHNPSTFAVQQRCLERAIKRFIAGHKLSESGRTEPYYKKSPYVDNLDRYALGWESTGGEFGLASENSMETIFNVDNFCRVPESYPYVGRPNEQEKWQEKYLDKMIYARLHFMYMEEVKAETELLAKANDIASKAINELRKDRTKHRRRLEKLNVLKKVVRDTMNDIFLWKKEEFALWRGELDEKS